MSDYEYGRERHHHHHRREEEGVYPPPPREEYEAEYERPPPAMMEYGAPPAAAFYGPPPPAYAAGPYGGQAPSSYGVTPYAEGYPAPQASYGNYEAPAVATRTEYYQKLETEGYERAKLEERRHKREEELAGVGALTAGAFAMHERHEVKIDPEHAGKHRLEEEIAAGLGAGAAGYALYEHHKKKESKEEMEAWEREGKEQEGHKKHHGWFG